MAGMLVMGCARTESPIPTPSPVQIRVTSDAATLPLTRALTDAYASSHPNTSFVLEWGNTPAALEALRLGRAQLSILSAAAPIPARSGPTWFTDLAIDSLSVIVNPQNKITNLSAFELREIFAGSRSRWSDVDAKLSGDIDLGSREANDPNRILLESTIMNSLAPSPNAIVLPSIEVMLNFVALQPGAIGYVPTSRAVKEPRVKSINLDGVTPTRETLNSHAYRMTIPIYLMAINEPQDEQRKFVAWALGTEGQQIVTKLGYISIK